MVGHVIMPKDNSNIEHLLNHNEQKTTYVYVKTHNYVKTQALGKLVTEFALSYKKNPLVSTWIEIKRSYP